MVVKKAVSVVVLVFVFSLGRSDIQAQTEERRLEVSGLYTTINLQAFDSRESGAGVRLAYNINKYLAVEAEGNVFDFRIGDFPTDEFLAAQGLLGIKTGLRNERVGIFAKVRPGVANFPELRVRRGFCFPGQSCDRSGRSGNRLAVDAGAVVELYPTNKIILRMDIGDTMIRFKDDTFFGSTDLVRIKDGFTHNAQFSAAIGYRF